MGKTYQTSVTSKAAIAGRASTLPTAAWCGIMNPALAADSFAPLLRMAMTDAATREPLDPDPDRHVRFATTPTGARVAYAQIATWWASARGG